MISNTVVKPKRNNSLVEGQHSLYCLSLTKGSGPLHCFDAACCYRAPSTSAVSDCRRTFMCGCCLLSGSVLGVASQSGGGGVALPPTELLMPPPWAPAADSATLRPYRIPGVTKVQVQPVVSSG
jgi:hypothetical protein